MFILQQVAEQLLPHIAAGEIPLHETIVIGLKMDMTLGCFISADEGMS